MHIAHETVLWSTPQLLTWIHLHLGAGHTLRGRDADADESAAGRFVCSCGVTLEVRPLIASDLTAGVHVVTGPEPLNAPLAPLAERLRGVVAHLVRRAGGADSLTLSRADLDHLREALR